MSPFSQPGGTPGRILVVDDSPVVRGVVAQFLAAAGYEVETAEDGQDALAHFEACDYDVVITDLRMPTMDGFSLLQSVRRRTLPPEVIILTGSHAGDVNSAVLALRLGAHDFLAKPPGRPADVILTVGRALEKRRLREANLRLVHELEVQSRTDALTGTLNRRSFDEAIGREAARAARYGFPLSLLLADLDHFKKINDTYGHPTGDAVLREAARRATAVVRETDAVFRYGGEEFAILLPHTPLDGAASVGRRVLAGLSAEPVRHGESALSVTASIGAACGTGQDLRPEALIRAADQALYEAKHGGRNRLAAAPPAAVPDNVAVFPSQRRR